MGQPDLVVAVDPGGPGQASDRPGIRLTKPGAFVPAWASVPPGSGSVAAHVRPGAVPVSGADPEASGPVPEAGMFALASVHAALGRSALSVSEGGPWPATGSARRLAASSYPRA